jgi:hypothetical protein
MAHRISNDGPLVLIELSGTLTRDDLQSVGNEIVALERNGANTPHRLTDFRQITDTAVGYADMSALVDRSRTRPLDAPVRSALVVEQPVQMGFARMFQILNEHPQVTVRIFEDETAARVWIATGMPNDDEGNQ